MTNDKQIEYYLAEAEKLASEKVKRLARAILKKNKNLNEFVMGMGTWFFVHKDGRNCDESDYKSLQEFSDFIREYDNILKITGEPMRFTAEGEKITNW